MLVVASHLDEQLHPRAAPLCSNLGGHGQIIDIKD